MARKRRDLGETQGPIVRMDGGVLRMGATRSVLVTESAFTFMQQVIHEQMPEFINYGLYEMGYRAGVDISSNVRGSRERRETAFRKFIEMYRQAGYGNLEVVHFDLRKPEALLRGHDLIETQAARESGIFRSPRAVDHYSRGMFAGLFSRLLGKEVICEELRCEYRGDPACEFSVLAFGGGS